MRILERAVAVGLAASFALPSGRLWAEEPKGARDLVAETDALVASVGSPGTELEFAL